MNLQNGTNVFLFSVKKEEQSLAQETTAVTVNLEV